MSDLIHCIQQEAFCFDNIETASLDSFLTRCQEARVVLLGESTHGSSEYYRIRARISKELISKAGFTNLLVEGDWPDLEEIDRYTRGHALRATPFLRFPQWMWRNRDFFQFVEWIKDYNARSDQPIRIYGLDLYGMQRSIESLAFDLPGKDPELAAFAIQELRELHSLGLEPSGYCRYVQQTHRSFAPRIANLLGAAEQRLDQSETSFHILQNLRCLSHCEEAMRRDGQNGVHWKLRVGHMFDTLMNVLDVHGPESKAIVWAHNTHVGLTHGNIGTLCKERLGSGVHSVGMGCNRGTLITANQWGGAPLLKEIPPAMEGSYERLFSECGLGSFFLPLQNQAGALLKEQRMERGIGVIYLPEQNSNAQFYSASLSEQFDEFIWFESTTPVIMLAS